MNDGSGDVERFRADGKLASITDSNGNVINLTYNAAGVLQQVASATTGETITFASNGQGLITSATDSNGQQVTYTYNAAGTQLLSATGPAGVTSYTYNAPTGSVNDNALTSITDPDGTQQLFTYNAQGWLASKSGSGGTGLLTYSYNGSGQVTITDALGNPTTLSVWIDR
jgi:YD repeat-containing protein